MIINSSIRLGSGRTIPQTETTNPLEFDIKENFNILAIKIAIATITIKIGCGEPVSEREKTATFINRYSINREIV